MLNFNNIYVSFKLVHFYYLSLINSVHCTLHGRINPKIPELLAMLQFLEFIVKQEYILKINSDKVIDKSSKVKTYK